MGFLSTLEKAFNGVEDFMIKEGNRQANRINRMTDEEIETRFSKPADEIRMKAETMQMQSEMMQMKKERREMEDEIRRMKQEQYEKNRLDGYGEYDDDF